MKSLLQSPINPEVVASIQEISRFNEKWKNSANLEHDLYQSLKQSMIITSAGASTRIEGAKLSDDEIRKRLDGLTLKQIRDRDEAEVAGYIECLEYIFENFQKLEISEHTIRSLHQMMCQYLSSATLPEKQRGTYKDITNTVVRIDHNKGKEEVVFQTTPPGPQTEAEMRELISDYNNYINDKNHSDLIVIAAFVTKYLAIHPFRDGNGRTSRLLTNLCLLQQGYSFCSFSSHEKAIEEKKDAYYIALRETQKNIGSKTADINPWLNFFLNAIKAQIKTIEGKLIPNNIGTFTKIEDEVVRLVQQYQPVSIGFLERESKIKRVTLKAVLKRLKEKKVIVQEGSTKASRYSMLLSTSSS